MTEKSSFDPSTAAKSELLSWVKDPERRGDELSSAQGRYVEVDRAIASHGNAPGDLLSSLSHSSDRATRARVAANPATPVADYLRLGKLFTKEFLCNPILDLLILENPNLLDELPESLVIRMVRMTECPSAFLRWAAEHASPKVQLAVAMNPSAPKDALAKLQASSHPEVRESIEARESTEFTSIEGAEAAFRRAVEDRLGSVTPDEALEAWEHQDVGLPQLPYLPLVFQWEQTELIDWLTPEKCWIARHSTPSLILKLLAGSRYAEVRWLVARDQNSQSSASSIEGCRTKLDAAANVSGSDPTIEELARNEDPHERRRVAEDPAAPASVLDQLSRDQSPAVRRSVSSNPNVPLHALEFLSKDKDEEVRMAVAAHSSASPTLLESMLYERQSRKVLAALVANPRTPPSIGRRARHLGCRGGWYTNEMHDAPEAVRKAAKEDNVFHYCGEQPGKAALSKRPLATLMALCSGPHVEPSRLAALAGSTDWLLRAAVARNSGTPDNLLARLRMDVHPLVRGLALRNPSPETGVKPKSSKANRIRFDRVSQEFFTRAGFPVYSGGPMFHADQTGLPSPSKIIERLEHYEALRASCLGRILDDEVWRHHASVQHLWDYLLESALEEIRPSLGEALWELLWEAGAAAGISKIGAHPACPAKAQEILSRSDDVQVLATLLNNPSISDDLRRSTTDKLAAKTGQELKIVASWHPIPSDALDRIAKTADRDVLSRIAGNPSASPALLQKLLEEHPGFVAKEVAANPGTPAFIIEELHQSSLPGRYIASNPNAPAPILEVLSKEADSLIRSALARNPGAPTSLLESIAESKDPKRRRDVAANSGATPAMLRRLGVDTDVQIRAAVAGNPNTPPETLDSLSRDSACEVRREVAKNRNTSPSTLEQLASEDDILVSYYAASNLNRRSPPIEKLVRIVKDYLEGLEAEREGNKHRKPALRPEDLMRALFWLECVPVEADNKTLTKASRSKDWLTRLAVALHPQASAGQLEFLAKDADPDVAAAARQRVPA